MACERVSEADGRDGPVNQRQTYVAAAMWGGGVWTILVKGVERGYTQASTPEEIEPTARELVSILLEVPEDSFDITVSFEQLTL